MISCAAFSCPSFSAPPRGPCVMVMITKTCYPSWCFPSVAEWRLLAHWQEVATRSTHWVVSASNTHRYCVDAAAVGLSFYHSAPRRRSANYQLQLGSAASLSAAHGTAAAKLSDWSPSRHVANSSSPARINPLFASLRPSPPSVWSGRCNPRILLSRRTLMVKSEKSAATFQLLLVACQPTDRQFLSRPVAY